MPQSGNKDAQAQLPILNCDPLREAFGKSLVRLAGLNPYLVVLDADLAGGTGVYHFRKAYPDRFFQFGVAEQNMMSVAGGMASTGLIPFVTTFAVFCMRAFEQARISIAYPRRNVKIVGAHPGLDVGPDGATAQSLEDLAAFRALPNMIVISPADALEMDQATEAALIYEGPVYMRTGRSPSQTVNHENYRFQIGKGKILKDGKDLTIVACGIQVARSLEAAKILDKEGISARVVNMSTIKPIDNELLIRCAQETRHIVTAEDHNVFGGLGSAVAEVLAQHEPVPIQFVGVKDCFGESGEPDELAQKYGLDEKAISNAARRVLADNKGKSFKF